MPLITKAREAKLAALEGLVSPNEGMKLAELASTVPADLAIVEIGSYRGKSACYLAEGAKRGLGAFVTCVDPWGLPGNKTGRYGFADPATFEAFHAQVATMGLEDRITAIVGFSVDVAADWTAPIGLLYVDGSHEYEDVIADIDAWGGKIVPGGLIVFDDVNRTCPGVKKAVNRLEAYSPDWTDWASGSELTWARRV